MHCADFVHNPTIYNHVRDAKSRRRPRELRLPTLGRRPRPFIVLSIHFCAYSRICERQRIARVRLMLQLILYVTDTARILCGAGSTKRSRARNYVRPSVRRSTAAPRTHTHTHTHPFNGPLSGTTRVSGDQKGKTNLDFTEARE